MRVAIVSTYPPRPCGIAVFSSDLRAALVEGSRLWMSGLRPLFET